MRDGGIGGGERKGEEDEKEREVDKSGGGHFCGGGVLGVVVGFICLVMRKIFLGGSGLRRGREEREEA